MNKILHTQTITILLFITSALFSMIVAQTTIGSNLDPNPLSLLDLKENNPNVKNANSTRGLGLPRVTLTDMNNLYPMFEDSPGSGTPNSQYGSSLKPAEDEKHTGLVVYNLNKCDGFGSGAYVWAGTQWEPLAKVNVVKKPDINITYPSDPSIIRRLPDGTYLVHLPSGKDRRTFPADNKFNISFNWEDPVNGTLISTTSDFPTDTPPSNPSDIPSWLGPWRDGGLKFLTNPASGWTTPPLTSSPVALDYTIKDMSDIVSSDNANTAYPYRSRETTVTFQVPANTCYAATQIKVRLNQTNYRMTFNRNNALLNSAGYRLRDQSPKFSEKVNYYRFLMEPPYSGTTATNYREETNARWNAQYEHITDGILVPDVVGTGKDVPSTGGSERIDGSFLRITRIPTYISSDTDKNRGKTAGILSYTDTATIARYYPIEVHFVQCASTGFDDTNVDDVGTATNSAGWGTRILKHTDQSGRNFYSASFGSAGRWMITNLAAIEYDTQSEAYGINLKVYQTKDINSNDGGSKEYAYPILDVSMLPSPGQAIGAHWDNVDWSVIGAGWRQIEGIFYNWYAATGRDYNDNPDSAAGTSIQEGANGDAANDPGQRQGICPNGWYLPTDREWNQLEQYVYENITTGQYKTAYDAIDQATWAGHISSATWQTAWNTNTGQRGGAIEDEHIGHGGAMKDICPPTASGGIIQSFRYFLYFLILVYYPSDFQIVRFGSYFLISYIK